MLSLIRKPALLRVLVLPWLVMWMIGVPLFHFHTLDAQESRITGQIVLAHTVYTPDLPGEYGFRITGRQSQSSEDQAALSRHFLHYFESAILTFSEDDLKRKNGIPPVFYVQPALLGYPPPVIIQSIILQFASPPARLLAASSSPRAPPSVSC